MSIKNRLKKLERLKEEAKTKGLDKDLDYMPKLIMEYLEKEDDPITDEELKELEDFIRKDMDNLFNRQANKWGF